MQTVIWTQTFETQARRCRLSDDELKDIVSVISDDPLSGDIIAGTGGARKIRHAGRGQGKSGGYRTIHYFGGDDVPVFLLAIYGKGTKANLTKAEKNELAKVLPLIADAYRKRAREAARKLARRRKRRKE
ncbi:type II toxin-antitoxin system RelE/ParE family toxin [Pelagibius sp. Alg239-R121]|uniref:type II toxin-antitoxin system RelE/ParE family toxin n=1 Tax=Pelagibius sp. Alg239-R121 TaxID=2993448 RepID=UPI0024A76BCE